MQFKIKAIALAAAATLCASAAIAGPVGYGYAVTGGGSTTAISASSQSAIQAAVDAYSGSGGLVINYTGTFDFTTITDVCAQHSKTVQEVAIKNKNDITIKGASGSSGNFGIRIKGSSSNVIVQNMKLGLLPGGDDNGDIIGIEGTASKVWIDHNEFFSSNTDCSGTGDTMYDGMIDIKSGTDSITVSYNYLHDHHKVALGGSSDSDSSVRHVTWHHNRFENVSSRTPMNRFGYYHVYNNYFNNITTSGINTRMGGVSLIEANYFENAANPVTSRDSSTVGYWDLRNNYVGTGITWGSVGTGEANATNWTTTKTYPVSLGYSYTADSAALVKCIVTATAGVSSSLATTSSSCGSSTSSSSSSTSSSAASSTASSSSAASSSTASSSAASSSSASTTPTLSGTGDYPSGFSKCAALGETCSVPSDATGWVAFGRKGSWVLKNVGAGKSIACTVAAFGSDPAGNPNKCSYQK